MQNIHDFSKYGNDIAFKDFMPWLQYIMPNFLFKRLIKYHEVMSAKEKLFRYFYVSCGLSFCSVAWCNGTAAADDDDNEDDYKVHDDY